MKKKIAVIGDGGWGTTVAILLCNKGYDVTIWGAFPEYIALLKKERVNSKFQVWLMLKKYRKRRFL